MVELNGLDDLLGSDEPSATFHDARLISVAVDYAKRELLAEWELCVGDPDDSDASQHERRRRGQLRLRDLAFWVVEPPACALQSGSRLPWLTADGPLLAARTETASRLAELVPNDCSSLYLFFSDWNAFAYFAAADLSFTWCA